MTASGVVIDHPDRKRFQIIELYLVTAPDHYSGQVRWIFASQARRSLPRGRLFQESVYSALRRYNNFVNFIQAVAFDWLPETT